MDAKKTTATAAPEGVRVGLIADQQQFVPTVADWWWHEWGDSYVDLGVHSRDEAEAYLRKNFLHTDRIPLCVVAWSGGEVPLGQWYSPARRSITKERVCGTVSLDVQDLAIRPHLGPWLVNTYVHPDFRGRSIMTLMLNDITQRAKDIGTKELYLWTPDPKVVSMYKRQGWNVIEEVEYQKEKISIMKLVLASWPPRHNAAKL